MKLEKNADFQRKTQMNSLTISFFYSIFNHVNKLKEFQTFDMRRDEHNMINKKYRKKLMVALAVTMLAGNMVACQKTEETNLKNNNATEITYLKTFFDIELKNETVSVEEFNQALQKLGSDVTVEGELTYLSAVKAAMKAANFEELVLSYPESKISEGLKSHGIKENIAADYSAYLACAIDTGIVTKEEGKKAAANKSVTKDIADSLLMRIANSNGDTRNYLANSNDPDIYAKIDNAWNSFLLFDDASLSEIGKMAVQNKIVTGFNIKNEAYNANFLPELTLQYGHSDIKHAHQLIGLLNSEGIEAKVQLEPKISIYEYLLEWGPIPESTPTYEVKKFSDDLYLTYAVEYDLQLEFINQEDMDRFNDVIEAYAKKYEGNEEAKGLIYGSWWQPLYSTKRLDMPQDIYNSIGDLVIENGMYSLHTFYLPENKDTVVNQLQEVSGNLTVKTEDRVVNKAFYHYLTGEDFQ